MAALGAQRKLRVGVFADARQQPRWLAGAIEKIARSDCAELVTVFAGDARPPATPWWTRCDRWAFGPDLCEPVALEPASGEFPKLLELDLDVALAIGDVDDTVLDGFTRLGVWRLHADGAHEVAAGEPVTGAALTVRLEAGAVPRIARESWGRTYGLSVARNRRALFERAAELPVRALRDAQRYGRPWLEQRPAAANGVRANGGVPLISLGGKILRRAFEKALAAERWSLAFGFGALTPALDGFTRIAAPRDRDWAHPFPLARGACHYVFFSDAGRIAMIELREGGRWSAPQRVLERDYPLAHPFLFEHENRLFLVPETLAHATVELYRCVEFPLRWRLERVLLEGVRLADPTIHRGADRWWMFAGSRDDELHLFHAPRPCGEWTPHRRNPVKSDARSSRPAGALYWRNGALCRPAQICVPRFGAGVALHRVLRLSAQEYAERELERVLPAGGGVLGLHTLNRAGALTVVDLLERRGRI